MRLTAWIFALGLGLAAAHAGCSAAPRAVSVRFAGPAPPPPGPTDQSEDPCAEPDMLDGLDDPCYVDVPPEEVRRSLGAAVP